MKINAIDMFCGIGGLTKGLENSGIPVLAGYDIEDSCKYSYEKNNSAQFIHKDIKNVTSEELLTVYSQETDIKVLVGCAPCQPFSSYSFRYRGNENHNQKMDLLDYFGDIVNDVQPEIVSMENVPQLANEDVFIDFINLLEQNKYFVNWKIVFAPDYGVPQNRKRLVLLASKMGEITIIEPKYSTQNYPTVRETIGDLPLLKSGETNPDDPMHRCVKLSQKIYKGLSSQNQEEHGKIGMKILF